MLKTACGYICNCATCSDLYDIGLKSDELSIVYNANIYIKVRVKTGVTNQTTMD